MNRTFTIVATFLLTTSGYSLGQTTPSPSDPQALALVAKSIAALTGGMAVSAATLNANAISIAGSDYFTGSAKLQAAGTDSRIDLTLNGATRSEIRSVSAGSPSCSWVDASAKARAIAQHNCWTDAAWFFPAMSSLSQASAGTFFYSYIGQEQRGGLSVEHIRVFKHLTAPQIDLTTIDKLSTTDIYLDSASFLPLVIAFKAHPDNDMNRDIPMEIRFANYQPVNGIQVPFHIQRLLNGGLVLDLTVTTAVMNTASTNSSSQVQ